MADSSEQTDPTPPPQQETGVEEEESQGSGGPIDVADFFPEVNDDLSEVTWGHGVNSLAELEDVLADPKVMMLEADILLGHLKVKEEEEEEEGKKEEGEKEEEEEDALVNSSKVVPIMAHPPERSSDLTFSMWLDKVIAANQEGKKKGVKLDFKDISVVKACLGTLNSKKDKISFPVWLNADILPGPVDSPVTPLPADTFLTLCGDLYPQATLSLGWTTHIPPSSTGAITSGYGRSEAERIVDILETHSITQPITFPIRAAFLPHSIEALDWLLETVPDSTITVWSSPSDPFDPMALVTLRDLLGPESVFVDLPPSQMTQYKEVSASSVTSGGRGRGQNRSSYLPSSALVWSTVGMALASALAALYLYE